MNCVVCSQVLSSEPHFANPWERSRRRYPCCSPRCAEAFDPDLHWLPAVAPEPAGDDEHARLRMVAHDRIARGDRATVVIREMLLAGVSPHALRGVLVPAIGAAQQSRKDARHLSVLGALQGLITGFWRFARARDPRDPADLRRAADDVDGWEQHWRIARSADLPSD